MIQKNEIDFQKLADEVVDGIYVCDLNGEILYANHALAWMLGYKDPEDITGKNFRDFLPPDLYTKVIDYFQNTLSTVNEPGIFTGEVIRKGGSKVYIEIKPTALIKEGSLAGNQGVVRDITGRKQEEQKLQYRSTHHSLTGLFNRTFFEAEMNRLERGRQFPISVVVVNVHGVDEDSDPGQSGIADKQLKHLAHILFNSFRGDDIVAHIGEVEFAILLPNVDQNTLEKIIKRVEGSLPTYQYKEDEPTLEFYIGAGTTKEGSDLNSVLKQAESIVYLGKKKDGKQ